MLTSRLAPWIWSHPQTPEQRAAAGHPALGSNASRTNQSFQLMFRGVAWTTLISLKASWGLAQTHVGSFTPSPTPLLLLGQPSHPEPPQGAQGWVGRSERGDKSEGAGCSFPPSLSIHSISFPLLREGDIPSSSHLSHLYPSSAVIRGARQSQLVQPNASPPDSAPGTNPVSLPRL